jgi:cardiolipin synthase A/B
MKRSLSGTVAEIPGRFRPSADRSLVGSAKKQWSQSTADSDGPALATSWGRHPQLITTTMRATDPALTASPSLPPTLTASGRILDRALARVGGRRIHRGNQLSLLRDGRETYEQWLYEIHTAERWIHLENYIFLDDGVGRRFSEALCEAAARGVKVRVLVDWFGSLDVSNSFWEQMRKAGVDVRIVNSPRPTRPLSVMQRDHRKLLAIDGRYGSVGGVCIADQWLQRSPDTGLPYRDTAVGIRGPAIADLELAFAGVWNRFGAPLPTEERPSARQIPPQGDRAVRVVIQEPGKLRMLWLMQLLAAGVQRRLWIADAYFLSVPSLHRALITAARDGVDVRLLTPAVSDLWMVSPLTRFGYRPLLEAGVRIWEYRGLMMHAKTTVLDGWWSRIGSTNLNFTGLLTNWEIDVLVEDRGFAESMEKMFEADLMDSGEVRLWERRGKRRVQTAPVPTWMRQQRRALERSKRETGARAAAAVVQAGGAALSGDMLNRQERLVMAGAGAAALAIAGIGVGLPRLLAWPIATVAGAAGTLGLLRAFRHPTSDRHLRSGAQHADAGVHTEASKRGGENTT